MFRIDAQPSKSRPSTVRLSGRLERAQVPQARGELLAIVKSARGTLELELSELEALDTAGVALISALYGHARKRGCTLRLLAASPAVERALSQFHLGDEGKAAAASSSWLLRLGESAISRWQNFLRFAFLSTDTIVWSLGGAKRTRRVRRGAIFQEANRIGVDALGIVGLISFLVGTVVALQSAYQLKQFGADIFVANLIGVSMTREMGPLMTAIIIAGRSGAAIAAEIATMSVNEEIDALRTLGLEPTRYIVVPKFQAITLTMPGLTVMANVLGIFGGFLVAVFYMDLGAAAFMSQLLNSLQTKDVLSGLLKSLFFAWVIVLVAAHQGFEAYGGAESVGRVTTSSVVSAIFWVIVTDAAFNMVFYF